MNSVAEIQSVSEIQNSDRIPLWNPDYHRLGISRKKKELIVAHADRKHLAGVYKNDPVRFILDFGITYDPRRRIQKTIPFYLFEKQKELILWLKKSLDTAQCGVVLKSRDMGATWSACCFSVWMWLYQDGSAVGWGSRKEGLVDRLSDPDSIFEKMRMQIKSLPLNILPENYDETKHSHYMRIINPDNQATIIGEAGDNIGRGGRKTIFFKDESAHYEHAEKIEGALSENTDVQIDISSVHGVGNVFYRRCKAPDTRLFRMFWRDNPLKTQSWYDRKLKKARDEGLEHIFRQEVDCDFTASVEGILIPGNLVQAAIDAHIKLKIEVSGIRQIGFDPYDGGGDRHALVTRHGILVNFCEHWGLGDTGDATRKVMAHCAENSITRMVYDSIGVGAGVSSEINRINKNNNSKKLDFQGFVAGGKVNRPEVRIYGDRKNKDMFLNLKAQECWKLMDRFVKTHNAVVNGKSFDPDEIISLDSRMACLNILVAEISQPTRDNNDAGKIMINKKPKGTQSPNLFDALVMAFHEKSYSIPKGKLWV